MVELLVFDRSGFQEFEGDSLSLELREVVELHAADSVDVGVGTETGALVVDAVFTLELGVAW